MKRDAFRPVNRLILALWRAGLGGPLNVTHPVTGRILVLSHVGRRSGRWRRTPLNYAPGEGEVYCLAGFGAQTDWFLNLQAHPAAEVWLPQGRFLAEASEVSDPGERLRRLRQVLQASGFAARAFAGIDPRRIPDEALEAQTREYRVVRLRLGARLRGPSRLPLWIVLALLVLWGRRSGRLEPRGGS